MKILFTSCLFFLVNIMLFSQISFEESSQEMGISDTFGPSIFGGGGVTFYDFNHDGWDDISMATTEGDSINFYLNVEGSFEKILPSLVNNTAQVKNILWADYDNDGDDDLFVTGYSSGTNLYQNQGDLTFIDVTLDAGIITPPMGYQGAAWGDIDNDGFLDLYITTNSNGPFETNYLFINNQDGTFEDITQSAGVVDSLKSPFGLVFSDLDSDGDQDMYLSIDHNGGNSVFINQGDNTFHDETASCGGGLELYSMCIAAGDYDNDGFEDFYFSNMPPEGSKMAKGNGDGTFTEVAEEAGVNWMSDGWGANWFDADLDGDLDLFVCGCHNILDGFESSVFYENQGDGTFTSLPMCGFENDTIRSYSNAIGDVDNDGYPDIVVNNEEGYNLTFWHNTTQNENHYLKVRLVGVDNNINGIGSWIEVYNDGIRQRRYTHSANGYLAQNTSYEIFGLGLNSAADSVKVLWLNGEIDVFYNVEGDQLFSIVEGTGINTGIEEDLLEAFTLYPNPAKDKIIIDLPANFPIVKSISILDLAGKHIKTQKVFSIDNTITIDINELTNGVYILNLRSEKTVFNKRFSVQN
jgi:hypothetical protein